MSKEFWIVLFNWLFLMTISVLVTAPVVRQSPALGISLILILGGLATKASIYLFNCLRSLKKCLDLRKEL